jgi:hypothetical protein
MARVEDENLSASRCHLERCCQSNDAAADDEDVRGVRGPGHAVAATVTPDAETLIGERA